MPDLATVLGRLLEGDVHDLIRLSGGASRETWSFDVVGRDGRRRLILQRQRPGASTLGGGMTTEAALLQAAAEAGVPVAPLIAAGDGTDDGLGAPWLVVERLVGETIARKLLRDDDYAAARAVMARQSGAALARIHSIPADAVAGLEAPDQIEQFGAVLVGLEQPRPALELGLRRLAATRPESSRRTVVHGDFRTGNLLVGPDGLRAVLDWELAHVGDPLEDLGWFCVRAWRFGSPARAGGFGSVDELVAGYGHEVDRAALQWWEAMGTLKWGVMCMVQAASHLTGATRSVELATIGRRVCENEWDLLQLLLPSELWRDGGPIAPLSRQSSDEIGLFGRPTAGELVEAVREYVRDDVMGQTDGRLRFHARVAANALAMVERELALGPAFAAAHAERLAALGFANDADLAAAIRSGQCDDRWEEVAAAVAESVRDQLLVANPRHLEPD